MEPMTSNAIDIIIVNFNSTDFALKCIHSIHQKLSLSNYNIVVIDNSSSDNPGRIKERYQEIDLILNDRNLGFARGRKHCTQIESSGELILLA
jgi:GT2 family glycosyltransferase